MSTPSYPILQNITKGMYNENVLRKNSEKTAEIHIEDSHPDIAELVVVQNMPKNGFMTKDTGQKRPLGD